MGFINSFISGIRSCCSAVCVAIKSGLSMAGRVIGGTIGSLGSKIGDLAKTVFNQASAFIDAVCISVLGPVAGPIVAGLVKQWIAEKIGELFKESMKVDDEPEEVGYRVEEAGQHPDWDKPDKFENFEEYYAYLKEQIPDEAIDREKLEKDKLQYLLKGVSVEYAALQEKWKIQGDFDFLRLIGLGKMSTQEIGTVVNVFKDLGFSKVALSDYLNNALPVDQMEKVKSALVLGLMAMEKSPYVSEVDALKRLNQWTMIGVGDLNRTVGKSAEMFYKSQIQDIAQKSGENSKDYYAVKDIFDAAKNPKKRR